MIKKITLLFIMPIICISQNYLPGPNGYYTPISTSTSTYSPRNDIMSIIPGQLQSQGANQTVDQILKQQEKQRQKNYNEINNNTASRASKTNYNLVSYAGHGGTAYYREAYDKMLFLNSEDYSIQKVNFLIENAYFENKLDQAEFEKIIKETGEFLIAKIKESHYDIKSNTAKNYVLFEFFTQTLQVNGFKEKHFPLKYDFEDYQGDKSWDKMFVTKLLKTSTGQCHSMPLLYLILAEEIGAEAYLSTSPNHSYIKFQDENEKWYNVELTNGMLTVPSFILNSGFIKAEAIQNQIYMQNLSKQQLLSQFYVDLALGYIHKFGYDEFIERAASKALQLYPNSITANLLLSNYYTKRFEFAISKVGINPNDHDELQKIKDYPEIIQYLNATNNQYQKVDNMGYQLMSADAYEKWLNSLNEAKNKQNNETLKKQFKGTIIKNHKG
jgi:hypothetical protein